uniref:Signal peptidase complex subunit 3 n=1 Tax=Myxobolus squamalis TaxID=59785 RepID=A0A6B2G2U9_MYXSQ
MQSFLSRINQLFSYFGYSFMLLAAFAALSNLWLNPNHFNGKLEIVSVRTRQIRNPSISSSLINAADFLINVKLDLSPTFHWNVKQVFLNLVVFYSTKNNAKNEVTVWDRIVLKSSQSYQIDINNRRTKYTLEDDGTGLLNNTLTFKLGIEMIPFVGFMSQVFLDQQPSIQMPDRITGNEYSTL